MLTELEPIQRLFMWMLATGPADGMLLKDMRLKLSPAHKRNQLESIGLIQTSGRPMNVELTDMGWGWCQQNLITPIATRSPAVQDVLQQLLQLLDMYFQSQDQTLSIGQLIQRARASQSAGEADPSTGKSVKSCTVEAAIEAACLKLAAEQMNVRIKLCDLRPLLSDFPREEVDQAIMAMELNGRLSAMRLDNPSEISDLDRAAVLLTPAGSESHIVYLQGTYSCS